jgi:hypothetical protein
VESNEIIAGFSDIKVRLRTKYPDIGLLQDFELWFTFDGEWLCAHDSDHHKRVLVLAFYNRKACSWRVFLELESLGERLTRFGVSKSGSEEIAEYFNRLFDSHGFKRFR